MAYALLSCSCHFIVIVCLSEINGDGDMPVAMSSERWQKRC